MGCDICDDIQLCVTLEKGKCHNTEEKRGLFLYTLTIKNCCATCVRIHSPCLHLFHAFVEQNSGAYLDFELVQISSTCGTANIRWNGHTNCNLLKEGCIDMPPGECCISVLVSVFLEDEAFGVRVEPGCFTLSGFIDFGCKKKSKKSLLFKRTVLTPSECRLTFF